MRLAYCIIAHTDPLQLARLVRALDEEADFFILVDRKSDSEPFHRELSGPNIHWTEPRVSVQWGSWSQVTAQMANLKAMLATGVVYDKVFSLSGLDYPLHSNKRIRDMVQRTRGWQIIKAYNVSRGADEKNRFKVNRRHVRLRVASDEPLPAFRNKILYPLLNRLGQRWKREKLYAESGGVRYDICFGSDYWAVDYDCAKYVYETMLREKRLRRFLRTCYAPVELYIHTIIYNPASPYRDKTLWHLQDKYPLLWSLYTIVYCVYNDHCHCMTMKHYKDILEADRLFFRKVLSGGSDELVCKVEEHRAEEEHQQEAFPPPFTKEKYKDVSFE